MKKRLLAIVATVAVMAMGVIGCGGSNDYSKCITLGEYKGIEIKAIDTSVSDEELQEELDFLFRVDVRDGDYINLDFTGYVDGKTFDGGSTDGKGYDLSIGSGTFIDGFEDGLIGAKVGDNVSLDLKFPENYEGDLAGKDVTFECTINEIYYTAGVAELTQEFVTENTELKTVEEYKESIRAELASYKEEEAKSTQYSELYQKVLEGCEVKKYPKALLEKHTTEAEEYYQSMIDYYIQMYSYYYGVTMTKEDMLSVMGTTQEKLDEEIKQASYDSTKSVMVMTVIAEKENIVLSDAEFEEKLAAYISDMGVESAEDFYKQSGYTEETLRQDSLFDKVLEFLMENAKIITETTTE
ncbi:MAG: hypothetical protein E7261_07895 [Lachnospiraceae bacterium]|nr:hypothetical protein [Lachnospiraceae bacterium]